jgi:hypothetical protein
MYSKNLIDMTYYDVKERVNKWFTELSIEEQRNELIQVIRKCYIFNHYMIISSGKVVFLFDIHDHHIFDMKLLDNLNKDEVYKKYFEEFKGKKQVRTFNEKLISNFALDKKTTAGPTHRELITNYLKRKLKINCDISPFTNFISFVSLQGLHNK